jgi:PAS domain-containing protein
MRIRKALFAVERSIFRIVLRGSNREMRMTRRRKRLQKSVRQERQLLQTMMNNLPGGIFLKDREGRFLAANRVTAELMQVPEPTVLATSATRLTQDENSGMSEAPVDRVGRAWRAKPVQFQGRDQPYRTHAEGGQGERRKARLSAVAS